MKTKITTKGGDRGMTSLYSGERISKSEIQIKFVGIVDELVSHLGLARVHAQKVNSELEQLQRDLFVLASDIATTKDSKKVIKRVDQEFVDIFEKEHERVSKLVEFPKDFILPGGVNSVSGAHIDVARSVARRLETEIVSACPSEEIFIYVNRVSDYLWLLARLEEGQSKMQKDI